MFTANVYSTYSVAYFRHSSNIHSINQNIHKYNSNINM